MGYVVSDKLNAFLFQNATVELGVFGWEDENNMVHYIYFDVYRMTSNVNGELDFQPPPLHTDRLNTQGSKDTVAYTLPSPGLYSVIARVQDTVNNTALARGLVLYDPDSSIETSRPINVVGARRVGSNYWLSTLVTPAGNDVEITWEGRYHNAFYEENDVLGPVKPFLEGIDDRSGRRTFQAVHNLGGIVLFNYTFGTMDCPMTPCPQTGDPEWQTVTPLTESLTLSMPRTNGDTFTFRLKAQDLSGDEVIDSINIHVDITAPVVDPNGVEMLRNTGLGNLPFYSR